MRQVSLQIFSVDGLHQHKVNARGRVLASVTSVGGLSTCWQPSGLFMVEISDSAGHDAVQALRSSGVSNLIPLYYSEEAARQCGSAECAVAEKGSLEFGDVLALDERKNQAEVLMRPSDQHHTVFLTNQCNSRCIMCSQPPTKEDDSWRVDEAIALAAIMTWSPDIFGFTGGEPLLLGDRLVSVLRAFSMSHPNAKLEILSNARLADDQFGGHWLASMPAQMCWMVPLYGHAPFLHDYVVQSEGAFDETILGLLNLQRYQQPIQLRIVLIRPVLEVLPALADFIALNLPFVREVALMGCEPIGYALANRSECEVDIMDWQKEIRAAVRRLQRGDVPVILMNTPLCALDQDLWPFAHRSISDWKRVYAETCVACSAKEECSGLFAWHERGWQPTRIKPLSADVKYQGMIT